MGRIVDVVQRVMSHPQEIAAFGADRAGYLASKFPGIDGSTRDVLVAGDRSRLVAHIAAEIDAAMGGSLGLLFFYPGHKATYVNHWPGEGPARAYLAVRVVLELGAEEVENADAIVKALRNARPPLGVFFRAPGHDVPIEVVGYDLAGKQITLHLVANLPVAESWTIAFNDGGGEIASGDKRFRTFDR